MENDRDVRDAILLLVNASNDYQTRNLALASAIRAFQRDHAEEEFTLCEDLQSAALIASTDAEATVEAQTKEVKSAFDGSGPSLDALTKFSTRLYLDFELTLSLLRSH